MGIYYEILWIIQKTPRKISHVQSLKNAKTDSDAHNTMWAVSACVRELLDNHQYIYEDRQKREKTEQTGSSLF